MSHHESISDFQVGKFLKASIPCSIYAENGSSFIYSGPFHVPPSASGRGFFCDHHAPGLRPVVTEFRCFKNSIASRFSIAAVFVGDPLTVFLYRNQDTAWKQQHLRGVHRCDNVRSRTVRWRSGNFNLCFAIIENLGSPVRMFALLRICIFKGSCAVKIGRVRVHRVENGPVPSPGLRQSYSYGNN